MALSTRADHTFTEASADLLSAIVDLIADPVMVKDEAHRWVFLNQAHCRLTGRNPEDYIGKSDYDFFPKEEADVFWAMDDDVLNNGTINVNEENHTDVEGRKHIVLTKKSLYQAPDGKKYIVGVFQDITERREKEAEIARLNAELARQYQISLEKTEKALVTTESKLEHSNRELEQFAHGVAYGLQVPLRKIQTFSEHLRSISTKDLSPEAIDDLERVIRSTYRMQSLVQDLVEISKIKSRQTPFERVDLAEVMKDVYYDLYFQLKETGSQLEVEEMPVIEADPTQMEQMFAQLVEFCLKPDGQPGSARILVRARKCDPDTCQITIENPALVLPAQKIEKLIDPFAYFYDPRDYTGQGIVLALVNKIVERHNGKIQVRSEKSSGTTFVIELPCTQTGLALNQPGQL